mgnify:CR=1 FL=1
MLTKADDYPIHQTAEPVAYSGTNRNFYDRYFFNGYQRDGDVFFAGALGVYPHLNVMDAAFCVVKGGKQYNVHASRTLHMERLDTRVGPVEIEVIEPLKVLRITCSDPDNGIAADLTFNMRCPAFEEPRFTRRLGTMTRPTAGAPGIDPGAFGPWASATPSPIPTPVRRSSSGSGHPSTSTTAPPSTT